MFILGLLLIAAGGLVVLTALFTADGTVEVLGQDLSGVAVFLLGLGAGAAILWGYSIVKYGARKSLQRRRERKQLEELSQKLDAVEAERRADDDDKDQT